MLELEELRFRNIGRFVDEQSISFDEFSSFAQLDGKNNNTGGSSGSGKSTVFMALDYLLGVNHRPTTVMQSRYSEEPLWVQGHFHYSGEGVIVTRSKGLIQVEKSDEAKFKGIKAEEFIDQMLGMPRDLFRKIIHKRQKEGGFFLNFTPKEMHDFLIDCIGLSKFKNNYEILDKELERIEDGLAIYGTELTQEQAVLSATQDAILSLGMPPIQDIHKEVILELKEKYDKSAIRFVNVQKDCESVDSEFAKSRPNISNVLYDATIRENLEKRGKEIEDTIFACIEKERKRQEDIRTGISNKMLERNGILARISEGDRAKGEATRIASEIKSIRSQTCPTCSQTWAGESSVAVEQQKLAELVKIKEVLKDSATAELAKVNLDKELSELKDLLNPVYDPALPELNEELHDVTGQILAERQRAGELYEQQNAETKHLLDEFVYAQGELTMKHKKEIDQARGQMDLDRRILDMAVQKLKSYEEARLRYDKTVSELRSRESALIEKTTKCRTELASLEIDQKKATESLKAAKTYVSFSFDQALDEISDKATKIIRCIPNMSNATIQFEGTKENKDGKVKEEVNAVISVDGEPSVPIKSLSGGEESAMDLAVDLAVIDYIETRSGMGMNLFILDEPFNGLGTVEIEMALEVLKNSNTKKKLIIVDHNPEVKQMVQSRLVVERTGLTSKVAQ